MAGLAAALLGGCASDGNQFSDPFSNPFASSSAATPSSGPTSSNASAPVSRVSSRPLSSSVAYNDPPPARVSRPTSGGVAGWNKAGGTPIVLAQGETVAVIALRYGVPAAAILKVNGYERASEVRPGSRLVIPVYSGRGGSAVASDERPRHVDVADRVRARDRKHLAERSDDEDEGRARRKARRLAERDEDREEPRARHRVADDGDREEARPRRRVARDEDGEPVKPRRTAEREDREESRHAKARRVAERDDEDDGAARHTKASHEHAERKSKHEDRVADGHSKRKDGVEMAARTSKASKSKDVAVADSRKVESRKAESRRAESSDAEPAPRKAPPQLAARAPAPTDATPTGSVSPSGGSKAEFRWPARGRITQGFKPGANDGINIAVPEGTSVKAAEGGVVAYAGSELKGYGNMVLIRHPNGFVTAYANNGQLDVKRGDTVKRGQTIAKSGQTGNVTAPQLHFEVRKGSTPVDPTGYLAGL